MDTVVTTAAAMDTWSLVQAGFVMLMQPINFGMLMLGVVIGIVAGSVPGLSANNTAAMLLPVTLFFPVETALVFIGSLYMACQYGGSISAILINTPGASGAIATTLDGFPLCRQGRAAYAMGLSLMGSTCGGILAAIITIWIMRPIAAYALEFGTAELFLLALLGIAVIVTISEKEPIKGGLAGAMGLLIAAMPAEPTFGRVRLSFGYFELYDGIPMVAAMCGFFAFPSMVALVGEKLISSNRGDAEVGMRGIWAGCVDTLKSPVNVIRSSLIGLFVGILPGAGVNAAALMAYSQAQSWSKNSKNFGNGEPDGVIAPEAANNATAAGALVPAITLGIPGSATTAVLLAALSIKGINPGPKVMQNFTTQVYSMFVAVLVATVMMFIVGFFYTAICSKLSTVNMAYMIPAVMAVCTVGVFATRGMMFDVFLFLIFGVIGYTMVQSGFQYTPLVLGIVMGKIAEDNFSIAIKVSQGSWGIFFDGGIAIAIWILLVLSIVGPWYVKRLGQKREAASGGK